jgi:mannitol-1-phosphate 5-dehydrogenase
MEKKKLVLFGAGKIGRSFIGQVFSRAGYEIVFIDISHDLVNLINRAGEYNVVVRSENGDQVIRVGNVKGVCINDSLKVTEELSEASIAAVSVGQHGLPATLPLIAKALLVRQQKYNDWPLDIIIAENMRNADVYFRDELSKLLPDYTLDRLVGLVETSIGKMVPIMTRKDIESDPLQVFAEPYNDLIVARNGFRNPVPEIEFLSPKDNIKAWVDRKLFIHNLGHATAAYLGHLKEPSAVYMYEVLENSKVYNATRNTMLQSADILMARYPGEFSTANLIAHIDDLLSRFRNKALGDTIFRVGCDLYRKLSPEDRLAAPIHAAIKMGLSYDLIMNAVKAAINFRAVDETGRLFPDDERFFSIEAKKGLNYILEHICGFDPEQIQF